MGKLGPLIRWKCDICGAEGDGVNRMPPLGWAFWIRKGMQEVEFAFCMECFSKHGFSFMTRVISEWDEIFEERVSAAEGLMIGIGLRTTKEGAV